MKKIIGIILTISAMFSCFAFDWPQDNVTKDSFSSYFGQNRGEIISTSIVFSKPSEVKAAEDGHVLIVMSEESDDSDFFPTTLGTSIILSHEDNLLSVYGNIDSENVINITDKNHEVKSGDVLGYSGSTGWQNENGNLEFEIVDTSNKTAINPKILMPRSQNELPLILAGVKLQSKNGTYYDINKTKTYEAGVYRIYIKKNHIVSPYKTTVAINGVTIDQITYDTISEENGKTCVTGKKKYTSDVIYPTPDLQLVGEANLTPGKATLSIYLGNILSKTKQSNFNITIY